MADKTETLLLVGVAGAIGVAIIAAMQTVHTSNSGVPAASSQAAQAIVQANSNALAQQAAVETAQVQGVQGLASQALTAGTQLEQETLAANTAIQELSMQDQTQLSALTKEGQITENLANIQASSANQQAADQLAAVQAQASAMSDAAHQQASAVKQSSFWNAFGSVVSTALPFFTSNRGSGSPDNVALAGSGGIT